MEKIYIVFYSNGEEYEDYQEFTCSHYFLKEEDALQRIEELKNNDEFMEDLCFNYEEKAQVEIDEMFWVEEFSPYQKEK